jgi:hypothetical protein
MQFQHLMRTEWENCKLLLFIIFEICGIVGLYIVCDCTRTVWRCVHSA